MHKQSINKSVVDDINLEPGTYVVAVSGGVDSISLLHILKSYIDKLPNKKLAPKLVVAHFDHGIREDSHYDRKLVEQLAKKYKIPFVFQEGHLGPGSSEADARTARYEFLKQVMRASNASAIITAHHKDDATETAIINVYRGTGRRGITSLRNLPELRRPLLHLTKEEIINYAKDQGLTWREDSTNQDLNILRNNVRSKLKSKVNNSEHAKLVDEIHNMRRINKELDDLIDLYLHIQPARNKLDKHQFSLLPHQLALEIIAEWLRKNKLNTFNSKLLENLVIKCKTLPAGKQVVIDDVNRIKIGEDFLALVVQDR